MKHFTYFKPRTDFHNVLRQRVDAMFPNEKSKKGGWQLVIKAIVATSLFIFGYTGLLMTSSWWMAAVFGFAVYSSWVLFGFNIMHDGAHSSASTSALWNRLAGSAMELLGGSQWLWKEKHNRMHHTYTNIVDKDDDLDVGNIMRLSSHQKWLPIHRFQWIYAWLAYSVFSIYAIVTDFQKYFQKRIGKTNLPPMEPKDHMVFWLGKIGYLIYALIIPSLIQGIIPTLIVFIILHIAFSLTMSIVFQVAHVVEPVGTFKPNSALNHDWASHQVLTTVDFAPNNKIINWCFGGLNFQVEHHLFHKISHIHYKKIQPIIAKTCEEFGLQYNLFPSFRKAIWSHARQLYMLSKPRGGLV